MVQLHLLVSLSTTIPSHAYSIRTIAHIFCEARRANENTWGHHLKDECLLDRLKDRKNKGLSGDSELCAHLPSGWLWRSNLHDPETLLFFWKARECDCQKKKKISWFLKDQSSWDERWEGMRRSLLRRDGLLLNTSLSLLNSNLPQNYLEGLWE